MKQIEKKTDAMRLIESLAHQDIEEVIRQMWVEEELSLDEVCKQLNVSRYTIVKWKIQAGVYSRKLGIKDGYIPF
jgi:response regulator of citrate/malate metabolism